MLIWFTYILLIIIIIFNREKLSIEHERKSPEGKKYKRKDNKMVSVEFILVRIYRNENLFCV